MAAQPCAPRIFVSYARTDGKELTRELRRRLSGHGFSLWQDLADMEGGKDWWRQITAAIEQVEYVILVMTKAALVSHVVRDEWRYARQRGRCVIPVVGAPEPDFTSLPGWMRRAHFVDPTNAEQWRRLVRTLESPCQAPRVPLMADSPPEDFVARPQEFEALRSRLLDPGRQGPVAVTAALRGAGGYGKTTLARALCHDDAIQDAFHDGILWVTLGEQGGDLGAKVEDLIVALSGAPSQLDSLEARKSRLAELLADRSLLLVIDDVWNSAHLEPFLVGGPRCARLITTRNSDTLPRGTPDVPVDAMGAGEAIELLRSGLPAGEDTALGSLARRLGEWPLLLKLVNGALRDRVGWRDTLGGALDHVRRLLDRRGLTAFDARHAERRFQAVAKTIEVSLELLTHQEQARFRELAVFMEDVDVPVASVEALWSRTGGLDDMDSEQLVERLFRLSLILNLDLATRRIRLHDVIRAYLRQGMGVDGIAPLDSALAEAHRERCPNGWPTGPDDGYFFQYLLWHLAAAQQEQEVRSLLLDCAWIEAKLRATGMGALLADYQDFARDATGRLMGRALHLSAHALVRDPTCLLSQLFGRIGPDKGLEIARLLTSAAYNKRVPWLYPRTASLTRPGGALLQTLEGHASKVTAVAVTPDGSRAISGSGDRTVKVWDLSTGQVVATLEGHRQEVTAVAVTADGRYAVSGSDDRTLKVWELGDEQLVATFEGHTGRITAVAVTPDGCRAVSSSRDGTLRVWDLSTGQAVATLTGHIGRVKAVAVTPDGQRAVSASIDGTLKVWDLGTGRVVGTLEGHTNRVTAVVVTPDGRQAISGSDDSTLKVWDLATSQTEATLAGHTMGVRGLAVTPDGRQVVSGSIDRTLKVWDLATGRAVATLEGHTNRVMAVAVTPDGRRVVSSSRDGTLKVWELGIGQALATFNRHTGRVWAVTVTLNGRLAVSGSHDRTVRLWEVSTGRAVRTLESRTSWITAVAVTLDGRWVVSGLRDGTMRIWDLSTGQEVVTLDGHIGRVWAVAVTPDGRRAVSASDDGTLRVWDVGTWQAVATLKGHARGVTAVAAMPDGRVVSGSDDRTLKVWDLSTGEVARTMEGHTGGVWAVAVTPDGQRVLSGSDDRTLKVWDLGTGEAVATLRSHAGWVSSIAVTPAGRQAVSGSGDGTLMVWELGTERAVASFHADGAVTAVACASDSLFVAGSADGAIHLLELR